MEKGGGFQPVTLNSFRFWGDIEKIPTDIEFVTIVLWSKKELRNVKVIWKNGKH